VSAITTPAQLVTAILADFPVFDTSTETDTDLVSVDPNSILFWATVAFAMLNAQRWTADGDPNTVVYNLGLEMFTLHHVTLDILAARDMDMAGVPGVATGVVAGKSAGDVAISYSPQATIELDAGHWNYTSWGSRFIRLARMMGAGPLQVNTPGCNPTGGGGWSGPFTFGE